MNIFNIIGLGSDAVVTERFFISAQQEILDAIVNYFLFNTNFHNLILLFKIRIFNLESLSTVKYCGR